MQEDIRTMTGESSYGRGLTYDEVGIDGLTGKFNMREKNAKKDAETGKYPRVDLGGITLRFDPNTGKKQVIETKPIEVVFLKIRRVLNHYHPDGGSMRTSEHNHKNEKVILYGPGKGQQEVGIAADLREKYQDLSTQQLVYCYFPAQDSVVRLIVKGASLGSKKETPGVKKFYEYLQTFENDDHFYQFNTVITPVGEDGPNGMYFAMSFERGERLEDEKITTMIEYIKTIHGNMERQDQQLRERIATKGITEPVAQDTPAEPGVKYPDEEINPEDIPFN